ncbi:rod-binding protein, partial [Borrelia crocidurae]
MLKSMKNTLNKENNLINGGQTEEIFEDMIYSE